MAFNSLLGQPRAEVDRQILLASRVVGVDLVHEIADMIREELGNVSFRRIERGQAGMAGMGGAIGREGEIVTPSDDLSKAPDWELRRLCLVGWTDDQPANWPPLLIYLNQWTPTMITWTPSPETMETPSPETPDRVERVAREAARRLENEGRRRLRWKYMAHLSPWLLVVLLWATWIWVLAAERPPASVTVLGFLGAVAVVPVAVGAMEWLRTHKFVGPRPDWIYEPGTRIRTVTRHELRLRKATWVLTIGGVAVGAVLSFLATLIAR